MTNIAVLLAGGTGRRIGAAVPKQLIEIGGRPLLGYSAATFDGLPEIDEILVVMAPGFLDAAAAIISPYRKVTAVLEGGTTRTDSTLRALDALAGRSDRDLVLFHDAARPFVDRDTVLRCLAALETHDAVAVGLPVSDTIVGVSPGGLVTAMPARSGLRRFQTPQGFRLGVIRLAYERALADPGFADVPATDDCGVVHRYLPDLPIPVVDGSERNLKVTHPLDVAIAEHLCAGES